MEAVELRGLLSPSSSNPLERVSMEAEAVEHARMTTLDSCRDDASVTFDVAASGPSESSPLKSVSSTLSY
jgi:hypothetical protein